MFALNFEETKENANATYTQYTVMAQPIRLQRLD